ncbi:MAG TPA: response regulator, partial [Blastocatellia bacterium]|nr:response regulator [Blastocatellia bacterium]
MGEMRVLLVEDDEDDFILTRRLLTGVYGEELKLDWANSYDAALQAMKTRQHDVCLLDYRLGNEDGLNLLREAMAVDYGVPVIFMTGQDDREIDLEAMRIGAADYLVKGQTEASLLERSIRYAIQQKRSQTERLELIREQTARLEAEEANRLKDDFLSTLSHELRTPLHSMLGWVHMLRKGSLNAAQTANALEVIERNIRAQHRLIEDLLDLSRIVTHKLQLRMQPVSLSNILNSVIESTRPAATAKNIAVKA